MFKFTVDEVARACSAELVAGNASDVVSGVAYDSRAVEKGMLFVCIPGERVNGNRFAASAIASGAAAVVVTEEPASDVLDAARTHGAAVLRADGDDPEEFLLRLAGAWRDANPQWKVVGVTGSVGKTTTKELCAAALGATYRVHATAGNLNSLIGLPVTVLSASPEDEVLVLEMGMNHAGELTRLSRCGRPDVALITNVGTSHIGILGSRENIARAKAEILAGMRPTEKSDGLPSCLFVTSDNDFADFIESGFAKPAGVDVRRVGPSRDLAVSCGDVTLDDEGMPSFGLAFADGWHRDVTLGIPGRHVVSDLLLAMAVADRLGADRDAAIDAVCAMRQAHMRLEVVTAPGKPRMIDDTYNASPSSIAAALEVLCSMSCEGRRVAVLGEVGELGDESRRLHGYIGAFAAAKKLDLLVFVGGEMAREMAEAARTMGHSEDALEVVADADEACRTIAPLLEEGDLVLAKASRSVGLDAFVKGVLA